VKPEDLKYAKTHEWVSISDVGGQKVATVGISAFAVEALTDLVFIELPKVGAQAEAEQPFCEVESVKAVSDVYAPVTGEVIEVNTTLPTNSKSSAPIPTPKAGSPRFASPTIRTWPTCSTSPPTRSSAPKRVTKRRGKVEGGRGKECR
jgi:glycine cleavage system H protein